MSVTLLIFLALIGLELHFGKRLGLKVYRFHDTAGYATIQSHLGILHFDESATIQWVAVVIIADFT